MRRKPGVTLFDFDKKPEAKPLAKPASLPPLKTGKVYDVRLDPTSRSQQAGLRHIAKARVRYDNERHFVIEDKKGKPIHDATHGDKGWTCTCKSFQEERSCSGVETARLATFANLTATAPLPPPQILRAESDPFCPRCGCTVVTKSGQRKGKRGEIQRFLCKACGHRFAERTILSHLRIHPNAVLQAVAQHFEGAPYKAIARNVSLMGYGTVTKSTIERWISKVGDLLVSLEAELSPAPSLVWHADETTIYFNNGKTTVGRKEGEAWIWNFLAHETRYWLAAYASKGRSAREGRQAAKAAKQVAKGSPKLFVTDGYQGYDEISRKEFATLKTNALHVSDPPIRGLAKAKENGNGPHLGNNVMERLQETQRSFTKPMGQFGTLESASRRLNAFRVNYNLVRPHEGLGGLTPAEAARIHVEMPPGMSRLEAVIMAAHTATAKRILAESAVLLNLGRPVLTTR